MDKYNSLALGDQQKSPEQDTLGQPPCKQKFSEQQTSDQKGIAHIPPDQENSPLEGLRYRKKLKLRLAVERAALELVIERGFDMTTVEDICARAEISKKTFFNYFPSKAAVIVGQMEAFPDQDELLNILISNETSYESSNETSNGQTDSEVSNEVPSKGNNHTTCYLDVLVDLIGVQVASGADESIVKLRRNALRLMPQLFFQGQRDLLAVQHSIAAALRSYLVTYPHRRMLATHPVDEEALIASSVSLSMARTRSMLHVCGRAQPSAVDMRHVLLDYLQGDPRPTC